MDIILGKERRRWSREDKLAIVSETFAPGAVILEIARRREISSGQIHTWRKQFRAELGFPAPETDSPISAPPMRFMPVAIAAGAPATMIEVELASGTKVKISGGVEASVVSVIRSPLGDEIGPVSGSDLAAMRRGPSPRGEFSETLV